MKNYKLAIVGATGVVGRTVLQVLQERNLPISKYVFFASKKSSVCKLALDSVVVIVASNKEESSNLHPLIL